MWKKKYADNRRKKYKADAKERERRKGQGRSSQENTAYMQKYYQENKSKFKLTEKGKKKRNAARRERYKNDSEFREKKKAEAREYQRSAATKGVRKRQRLKKYGITLEQFNKMLSDQKGKCAICGHSDDSKPLFFPVVDHCHDSKGVRGLLCMNCNQGLGKFKDDLRLLRAAITYLKSSKG